MFLRYVLQIKTDLILHNFYGQDIRISNDGGAFNMVSEIWIDDIYRYLGGCNHFLDVGGFLGESAIYLATINNKVTVYEADLDNYVYLSANIAGNNKIAGYHKAVVGDNSEETIFYKNNTNDPGASMIKNSGSKQFTISCINFFSILKQNPDIDGLKLDIEGGEYDIITQCNSDNFGFKKGQIEFHDLNESNLQMIINFVDMIRGMGYNYDCLDTYGKIISFSEIRKLDFMVFTLYFYKNSI